MNRIPFNPDELSNAGYYESQRPGRLGARKYDTPISPKDNYTAAYRREQALWIPMGIDRKGMTPRIDPDNVARCFVSEAQLLEPEEMVGGKDKHGIEWVYVPVAGGSMVKPGSPTLEDANDWEKVVPFPDLDSWDWAGSRSANQAYVADDGRALTLTIMTGFYERLISLMDFENAAVAMIDEDQKDAVKALFDRLADLYIDMAKRYKEAYNPTVLCLHDDWGSQRAPFFSLATVREMIVPAMSRVAQAVHDAGMFFDIHSCGKNEVLVPAYIEAGADSWSGQSLNDKAMLHELYGDKLIIGLDPDIPLSADLSDEEAVAAAKRFVQRFGPSMEKKPFYFSGMGASIPFMDTLYEESRKMLS